MTKRIALAFFFLFSAFASRAQSAQEGYPLQAENESGKVVGMQVGSLTFVVQKDKGLQIIDAANPEVPQILSQLPLPGIPHAIYYINYPKHLDGSDGLLGRVQVIMNAVDPQLENDQYVGRIYEIEVYDPKNPLIVTSLAFQGWAEASHNVVHAFYLLLRGKGNKERYVNGFNYDYGIITDFYYMNRRPAVFEPYQRFIGKDVILSAQNIGANTELEFFDIAHEGGIVRKAEATIKVKGRVLDGGLFANGRHVKYTDRYIHGISTLGTSNYLQSFQAPYYNEPSVTPYKALVFPRRQSNQKARFIGERAYVYPKDKNPVSGLRVVDVINIQDPAAPKLLAPLTIPAWVMDMKIIGNRIVGIGSVATASGNQMAAAIFDTSGGSVREMSRLLLGTDYDWEWKEFWQDDSLKLFENQKLLLLPLSSKPADSLLSAALDLDLDRGTLGLRKQINLTRSLQGGSVSFSAFPVNNNIGSMSRDEIRFFDSAAEKSGNSRVNL